MIKVKRGDGWWCFACGDVWKGNDAWSSETNLSVVWSAMWNDYFSRRIHIIVIVQVYCMEHCVAHQYFELITAIWEWLEILRFILCFKASWAFLVFTKMLTFWVIFMTGECGNIGTPPLCGKISHVISFFSDEWHARLVLGPFNQYQVTQIDQISLPPYCKTCFSTSGWFWHAKKTWQTDKKSGFGSDPPPSMGKIPT